MASKRRTYLWTVVFVLLVVFSFAQQRSSDAATSADRQFSPEAETDETTGAGRCVFCHRSEVEGYARSAMAHSLRRAGKEPDGTVKMQDGAVVAHSSPAGYFQRFESRGDVTNYRIDYVIGSGNHASGYLLDLAGHLFQSPVAYYASRHAYDLAPGYEGLPNPDFTRPVAEACVFCHSGTPLHVSGTSNDYASPPFAAEAITCERCHGSAEKHLNDPRAGTIVNPARLDVSARDSVCEQCHLLGVGRVLNPGKHFVDFRPGEPLENVFTTYTNTLPPDAGAEKFKVISHVEQLARSTCSRQSKGQLWCGTCHDAHNKPAEPVAYYRSKCLGCHTGNFSTPHPGKQSDCIGCHMPRRAAKDGGHTAFTDHRIQPRPEPDSDSALPADIDIAAWRQPGSDLQKRNLGIAYVNVGGERRSPQFIGRGYRMLTELQEQFSGDSAIFTAMGTALLLAKQTSEAELAFDRAAQLDPQSATAEMNAASAYLQAEDVDKAKAHLERARVLDPLNPAAAAPLIEIYRQQGNTAKADELAAQLKETLENQPSSAKATPEPHGGQAFKNIQVLKNVPPDQLIAGMRFITASLGVECNYCHVPDHFDRDEKKPKQIARDMMRMMFAINQQDFEGSREVTCYSCHQGSRKPAAIPPVGGERAALHEALQTEKLPADLPTADQLLNRYIQALGGADALAAISSREEKGTVAADGKSSGIEIFAQSPDKIAVLRHTPTGDSGTVFNGEEGWSTTPGRPAREMRGADIDAARMDADLQFPAHIKAIFPELSVEYPEKVGDHEAFVLVGKAAGKPAVRFYFDQQSGLLIRLVRYAESPLGLDPTQIDYSDYRNTGGVEIPFQWTVQQPGASSTVQVEEVRQNIPIDDAKFAKPNSAKPDSAKTSSH